MVSPLVHAIPDELLTPPKEDTEQAIVEWYEQCLRVLRWAEYELDKEYNRRLRALIKT